MSVNAPLLESKQSSSTATGGRVTSYGSAPIYRDSSSSATEDTSAAAAAAAAAAIASVPPPDSLPLYACLFVYFANVSAFSLFETIASPFLSDMFDWSVGRVSVYFLCCTVQMLLMFLFVVPRVQRKFGLRPSLAIGLSLTAVGLSVMPRWWDVADQDFLLQYSGGTFFFLLGYPIAQVMIMQLYAGLLRPELQPVYISFIVIAGCTSRVAGPLWATTLYSQDKLGRGVYLSCAGLCVLAVATVAAVWSRLVSYTIAAALESYDASVTHQPANANAPAPAPILKAGGNSDFAEYQSLPGDAAEGARPKSGNMSSAFAAKPKSVTFDPELPEPDSDQMHANSYRAVVGLSISREIDNV
jgi:hypothetical protein